MGMDYQLETDRLFGRQRRDWNLLRENLEGLRETRIREFAYDGFSIRLQYNPGRIISSAAKVDSESISMRKCFLCAANRPPEQEGLLFEKDYEILINPYPIFDRHFTIAKTSHAPQQIEDEFSCLLDISRALPQLVVFYNGPRCGASAPDHQHFQAGNLGFLPLEDDFERVKDKYGKNITAHPGVTLTAIDDGLRRFIVLESPNREELVRSFHGILTQTRGWQDQQEAMMNILSYYCTNGWRLLVFLRERHRPRQYYEEGEKNILISPAAVDFGGTLISPLEKDFVRITGEDISDIFHQVTVSQENFELVTGNLNQ